MTDNEKKEIAQAYRIAAKRLREADTVVPALSLEQWAKELDPSRPAPGMVVWWRDCDGPWQRGLSTLTGIVRLTMDGEMQTYGWAEIDYKLARIAGPMQEIVDIPPISEWPKNANGVNLVYETNHIGTTYIAEIITRAEAERMEEEG